MKFRILSSIFCVMLLLYSESIFAQDAAPAISQGVLWIFIIFMMISISLLIGDNMVRAQATMGGVRVERDDSSFFPGLQSLLGRNVPRFVKDGSYKKLSKGHDIKLNGAAALELKEVEVKTFAVQPGDFRGIAPIPKMMVEVGQEIEAGQALFYDKAHPDIHYVSPVSGEVAEIRRGAKRAITHVILIADRDQKYRVLPSLDLADTNREELTTYLKSSGFWPIINQRPFDIVADPERTPRDIFISTFNTGPLAADQNFVVAEQSSEFQKGIDVLVKLTDGDVHLGLDGRGTQPDKAFSEADGVKKHWFNGKHPVGNVGIQMHHIDSIRPADMVWTLTVEDVILLGDMILNNRFRPTTMVAITGNGSLAHHYVSTMRGASIADLLKLQEVDASATRVVSGDVLSGIQNSPEGYLHAHDSQLTLIPEGNQYEMFGWMIPALDRPTISKTYPTFLFSDLEYDVDTNTHGEKRAFVQTGQYESMLPADIFPQHLMKSILVNDFEKMEGLGIHELSEEDIALCEFACTSKMPLQKILRDGLDAMQAQG